MMENTPVHVRALGTEVDERTRRFIADRTARRLGKFAPRIARLTLRFEDVNGPRVGRDRLCRGKVVLRGLPSVLVEKRAHTARAAFDQVSQQLARGIARAVRAEPPVATAKPSRPHRSRTGAVVVTVGTAHRNRQRRARKATVALEDSATGKPSRKSTRKSAHRAQSGNKLGRTVKRKLRSPQERARRAARRRVR